MNLAVSTNAGKEIPQPKIVNFKFLEILVGIAGLVGVSVLGMHRMQVHRNASSLLEMGQNAREAGDLDIPREYA